MGKFARKEMVIGGAAFLVILIPSLIFPQLEIETDLVVRLGIFLGFLSIIWLMLFAVIFTVKR